MSFSRLECFAWRNINCALLSIALIECNSGFLSGLFYRYITIPLGLVLLALWINFAMLQCKIYLIFFD